MEQHFFEQLLAIMGSSLVTSVVLHRLGMSSIIAYLLAGCLIGPHVLNWVDQPADFTFLAEFGVVFLLFSLGLEFSLPKLIELRSSVFGLGGIQVVFCSIVFGGAVYLWGTSPRAAILIAGALALSSTAIVTKELMALRQLHSPHGQLSVGVLLFQDLIAALFLILVPILAAEGASLWRSLGLALAKGLLLLITLLSVGKWLLPALYKEVARARSEEIFVLSTLVIVLLAAWVTQSLHLSMTLGGFIIGMMLGESDFRHQINSDIRGFKDILLGLFFVTVGMSLEVRMFFEYWPRLLLFTALLILIKTSLIGSLIAMSGDKRDMALQTGLNLAQAGEFGLALLALGVMHNLLPNEQASFIIMVVIFSMAASPFLIRHGHKLVGLLTERGDIQSGVRTPVHLPHRDHVIIGGYGRVGRTISRLLEANGIEYIAIDHDIRVVAEAREAGHNVVYGDCCKTTILRSCHIDTASMAILTFGSVEMARDSVEHIRSVGVTLPLIVRCSQDGNFAELEERGADYVVPEMLEASLAIGARVLNLLGIDKEEIDQQIELERNMQLRKTTPVDKGPSVFNS